MKYQVISHFIDKNTQVYYPRGAVYETGSKKRAEELQKGGYIGATIETPLENAPEKPAKGDGDGSTKTKSS